MKYKCKDAVLDLRRGNTSSAFFVADQLLFLGSSTVAMKYFVDHCGSAMDSKTLSMFRERIGLRNKARL